MLVARVSRVCPSVPAFLLAIALLHGVLVAPFASGCTRVVFLGANGEVIAARCFLGGHEGNRFQRAWTGDEAGPGEGTEQRVGGNTAKDFKATGPFKFLGL